MAMTQAQRVEALEALVDSETLGDVLIALHLVCLEKAEHLRCNWQDELTAKVWERAANAVRKASEHAAVGAVS
jgi:hypothetical protein